MSAPNVSQSQIVYQLTTSWESPSGWFSFLYEDDYGYTLTRGTLVA